MIARLLQPLVLCIALVALIPCASAQEPSCRYYKVQSSTLSVSNEPGGDAASSGVLDNADVVCVTREQSAAGRNWGFVAHKLVKPDQPKTVAGWVNLAALQPLSYAEAGTARGLTTSPAAPPPAASPPPTAAAPEPEQVVRFDEPLKTGPPPVNGRSLEQLVQGIPLFPPIEGLDDSVWKKNCSACHKWDRRTLCEQGATYLKDPKMALRGSHPYGGPEKVAIMQWAKTGCQ